MGQKGEDCGRSEEYTVHENHWKREFQEKEND